MAKNTTTTGVLSIATAGTDYGVPSDTAYDATSWNGNTDVPTKNAVRDKIETLGGGGYGIIGFTSSDTAVATGKVKGFVVCKSRIDSLPGIKIICVNDLFKTN